MIITDFKFNFAVDSVSGSSECVCGGVDNEYILKITGSLPLKIGTRIIFH